MHLQNWHFEESTQKILTCGYLDNIHHLLSLTDNVENFTFFNIVRRFRTKWRTARPRFYTTHSKLYFV